MKWLTSLVFLSFTIPSSGVETRRNFDRDQRINLSPEESEIINFRFNTIKYCQEVSKEAAHAAYKTLKPYLSETQQKAFDEDLAAAEKQHLFLYYCRHKKDPYGEILRKLTTSFSTEILARQDKKVQLLIQQLQAISKQQQTIEKLAFRYLEPLPLNYEQYLTHLDERFIQKKTMEWLLSEIKSSH